MNAIWMIITFKTAVKHVLNVHSQIDKTKILMTNGSLMKVKVLQIAPLGAFCNTYDMHKTIIGLEKQILVFLRVAVLHWFLLYIPYQNVTFYFMDIFNFFYKILNALNGVNDQMKSLYFAEMNDDTAYEINVYLDLAHCIKTSWSQNIICCPDFISLSIPCVLVDSSVWVDPGEFYCTYHGLTD